MIAVVQRVSEAAVRVDGEIVGQIGPGLLVLASVHRDDTDADLVWTANKLTSLRVFRNPEDPGKHFDIDVKQAGGAVLLVSNFTVAADTRRGRRPSFDAAAPPNAGRQLFDRFTEAVRATGTPVQTGRFGADMEVSLVNDGPVTLLIDSRESRKAGITPAPADQ
jgi:D-tyrosyl-tRNA(Tyr) deacylase